MKLRQRLEKSDILAAILSGFLAGYLRFCFATSRWKKLGLDDLANDLKDGPVIVVLWHRNLLLAPSTWPKISSEIYTLRDPSPAGRLSSDTQTRLGMRPIMMHAGMSNFTASRKILQIIRGGGSLGMTADGPTGPNRMAKQAPIEWARATGRPVYLFAWGARRTLKLATWDTMIVPLPFTRGRYAYRRWNAQVARKLTPQDYTKLRIELSRELDAVTNETKTARDK